MKPQKDTLKLSASFLFVWSGILEEEKYFVSVSRIPLSNNRNIGVHGLDGTAIDASA